MNDYELGAIIGVAVLLAPFLVYGIAKLIGAGVAAGIARVRQREKEESNEEESEKNDA